jgi:hypothetical protein
MRPLTGFMMWRNLGNVNQKTATAQLALDKSLFWRFDRQYPQAPQSPIGGRRL